MKKADLRNALNRYQSITEQIATLEKQKADIAERIKDEMGAAEELQVDDNTIRYKTVTINRFDVKAFQNIHRKMYERFLKPQTTRRFTVA